MAASTASPPSGGHECHQLSFVRDVERIEAEDFAGAFDFVTNEDRVLFDSYSTARAGRDLLKRCGQAATSRVPQSVNAVRYTNGRNAAPWDCPTQAKATAHPHEDTFPLGRAIRPADGTV